MRTYSIVKFLCLAVLSISFINAEAQSKKKKVKKGQTPVATKVPALAKGKIESFESKVKGMQKQEGLFDLYRDTTTGELFMAIKKEQFNQEFIYFCYSENGPLASGHNRGIFRETKVFKIENYYNRIEFVTRNNRYHFDTSSALYKAKDANIIPGMMLSERIAAQTTHGDMVLINADNIFLKEVLHQVKPTPSPLLAAMGVFQLGNLNIAKSRYEHVRNYPENTDVIVKYVFDDPYPKRAAGSYAAEARYTQVILQHSFIALPQNNFKPRLDDQRVGYFTTQGNDMTTTEVVNYKDYIHRWNLVKKNPTNAISEPVKPITWWIENTTPHEYRETIKEAVLAWNIAFEKAGFRNAMEVKVQPDDADWDAGDIRYNVLRWTSSPQPPFGGYGPSFVNPLTGEILGADVMLEFVFLTGRLQKDQIFEIAALPNQGNPFEFTEQLYQLKEQGYSAEEIHEALCSHQTCAVGQALHQQNLLASYLNAGLSEQNEVHDTVSRFIKEALFYLVLHEVGHTLGLSHNMRASHYLSPEELQDINITREKGVIASVMDYPALNFANTKGVEVQQYNTKPGPYDIWAIVYGYSPELHDADAERERLQKILGRSVEKELRFGNDADDMRAPGKGIDPRVNIFDLSNDPILFAKQRMDLVNKSLKNMQGKFVKEGNSYHELRNAYMVLTGEYATQAGVISRFIGGVQAERQLHGQAENEQPLTPVDGKQQRMAMKALSEYVFAPNANQVPEDVIPYLQPQRRGFGFFVNTEDPKLHDRILQIQVSPLAHILAPTTLKRISNSRMYGNDYSLIEIFSDLNAALFDADLRSNISTPRQNLQITYLNQMNAMVNGPAKSRYDNMTHAAIYASMRDLQRKVSAARTAGNAESTSHKQYVLFLLEQILEPKN